MRDLLFPTLLLMLFATYSQFAKAQTTKRLKINDTLPSIQISNLIKPQQTQLTTKNLYQGKTLIINFWATWCTPCIREMKELAKLVDKYDGRLEVLSLTYESRATVEKFLAKQPELANSKIHIATNDETFNKIFFHQGLPHNAWVNSNGVVKAITGGDAITEANILAFIKGIDTKMYMKLETRFDKEKPLQIPDSVYTFRTTFSKVLPGVEMSGNLGGIGKLGYPSVSRFLEYNSRIISLFWAAHQMPAGDIRADLLEVQTADSSRFFWPGEGKNSATYQGPTKDEWQRNNRYTYEFVSPKPLPDSIIFPHIIKDLELHLGIKSYRKPKKTMCRVVTYDSKSGKIKKAAPNDPYTFGIIGQQLVVSNVTVDYLLSLTNLITFKTQKREPYLNHTNIKGSITAKIDLGADPKKYSDTDHWQKCFSEQLGLKFETKEALYPVLVLKDLQK